MGAKIEPILSRIKAAVALYFSPLYSAVSFFQAKTRYAQLVYRKMSMIEKIGFLGSIASIAGLTAIFLPGNGNSDLKNIWKESYGSNSLSITHIFLDDDKSISYTTA